MSLSGQPGYEFWLSVVFVPAMLTMRPCWVTLTLWIVTPAGSFGMVMVKLPKFPSAFVGIPLRSVTWTWIWFGPDCVTSAVASTTAGLP